ncbi:M60 family metallopeptidase [Candidatus Enterococcus mangumiae]|uniref:S-layer protein n=1 Tax=Candidatus Enterococcus mangumiae TaxID=2230878 RepID=A0ABZ2SXT0_9ENTE|nr:M60 family metallopeptidase [Enterococcus sp. DIV1094]MBO0490147.1 M60 family metallopeptidase [Enterococcus sp. DIV1094]
MKKYVLFSTVLLGMVIFSNTVSGEEVIKGETGQATVEINATNQNVSKKLTIKQSENLDAYKGNILDNPYGPSTNQSTGIYKRATDVIEIYVDESTDQTKLPTYTITTPALTNFSDGSANGTQLVKGRNVISGSQVGLIHFRNESGQTAQGKISIEIKGGIEIPRFILGETTQQEWTQMLANDPNAVGYELVSDRVLVTGSNRTLQDAKDPKSILEAHEKVISLHNQSSGLDGSSAAHRTPIGMVQHLRETIQSGYYMYAFYQHTAYSSTSDAMRTVLNPTTMGQWGIWHELGHTYQLTRMNWKDLAEVTVNIYSLRAEKALGQRSRLERENRYTPIFNYLNGTGQKQFDSQDVWVRLGMFWQLELAFGDDFYPNLHKMYRNEQRSLPSEQDKRQYFVVAASKISGRNLQPFFEKWGIEVTTATKTELAKLPNLTKKIWEYRDEMTGDVGNIEGENGGDEVAPTTPTGLTSEEVTSHSVKLKWNPSTDNTKVKGYRIYRNGVRVGTTETLDYTDQNLASDTTYVYQVSAFDEAGNESEKTQFLTVVTKQEEKDTQAPSIPTGLTAGTVTANSAQISWGPSTDNNRVAGYNVYRNGVKVNAVSGSTFTDTNLASNTAYTYQVSAYDAAGNESEKSQAITITTKDQSVLEDTWRIDQVYTTGDLVIYNGIQYRAKWWIKGERPDTSQAWEKTDKTQIEEWSASKAYSGGDRVTYKGKTYQAKWWNTNANPETSDVWALK